MSHASTKMDWRKAIQANIRPFKAMPPDKQSLTFVVGWTDCPQTFEQITDTLSPQIVKDLFYFKKITHQYIGDLLQQGWLRLWQSLQDNVNLLKDLNRFKAADLVSNRCGASTLYDYLKRYDSYHDFSKWNDPDAGIYEDNITEIVIGSSLKSGGQGRHALFTRTMDRMIDIQNALKQVAEWCMDDMRKLAALYYLTTSVGQIDAGRIAGLEIRERSGRLRCPKMGYWTKMVLTRLREAFASYMPIEPNKDYWREQVKVGVLEPVIELANKYKEDEGKLLALYILTTSVGRETVVKECGVKDSVLWYAMKQLRQELRCMYARKVSKNTI